MKRFNCKITKWYYFLIFYYNSKHTNENINKINLDKCKKNGISYLFYEPIQKQFYIQKNNKFIPINELILTNQANLDSYVTNTEIFYNMNSLKSIKMGENTLAMKESFIKDFSEVFNIPQENNIFKILQLIKEKIKLNGALFFEAKCKLENLIFCPPNKYYVLLYKKRLEKDFIAVFIKRKKVKYIVVSSGKEIDYKKENIYESLDSRSDYYYCLSIFKKLKPNLDLIKNINFKEKIPNIRNYKY